MSIQTRARPADEYPVSEGLAGRWPAKPSLTRADLLAIAIPTLAGALLTAIDLGTRSLWLDEGSTFAIVSQHGAALWRAVAHDGGNMLIYYLGMHLLLAWFGDATWVMRLPSVIATAATGGLVAALALRLFPDNRRLAGAAGLLTVISLPLVYWGQNARGYAWLVTLAVGSFLALAVILQTPPERAPARGAVAAYLLTTLAALYIGYDFALLIPGQLALLLIHRERARLVIGCLALTLVLCTPLAVLAVERGSSQLFWVTQLHWAIVGEAMLTLLAALPPDFHTTAMTYVAVAGLGLGTASALVAAARPALRALRDRRPRDQHAWPVLFMLSWALVPTVLTVLFYAAGEPVELPRVTILVIPVVALLLAWLLLRPARTLRLTAFGTLGVVLLLGLRLTQVVPAYGVSPEPWNTVTAYVLAHTSRAQPACVIFYAQDGRESFDYYLLRDTGTPAGTRNPAPDLHPVLPSLGFATVRPFVEQYATLDAAKRARVASACPRLWIIASHNGDANGTPQSRANLRRYQRMEQRLRALYPYTTIRTFGWSAPINVRLLYRSGS
ncbi:hypothetical protein [Conexibacter sp. S30A1]|uniref:glycosyltransferase family 39 protein n=1 Tax=Conexibacter sp. S30A1 TaxID=2937800 RepID=UPI00200EBD7E|nr:hypothetical protein [Conexibacter sp. S30A1]